MPSIQLNGSTYEAKEGEFDPAVLPGLIDFSKEPLGTEVDRQQPSVPSQTDTATAPQDLP